jgi:hypothetical protein
MAAGQETNRRHTALVYSLSGKIRWYVRPRKDFVNVVQKGRFSGDEPLWTKRLSDAGVAKRKGGADLGFYLYTKPDFDAFQQTMERDAPGFHWEADPDSGDEHSDNEEND